MKNFFIIMILVGGSIANAQSEEQIAALDARNFLEYEELFEQLISAEYRVANPDRAKKSFVVHLRDNKEFFPEPDFIKKENFSPHLPYTARGRITYVRVVKAKYAYDLYFDESDSLVIHVKMNFRGADEAAITDMKRKFAQAQALWNEYKFETNFNYHFRFEVVDSIGDAHLSVPLREKYVRGPYFIQWSSKWTARTIAHELGHVMGLGDEYQTLSGKQDCLRDFLMCSSSFGEIVYQYHYHVLRRAMKGWRSARLVDQL